MARETWFVSRPHRRLVLVPQSLAAFTSVAKGQPWRGNAEAQMAFEDAMDYSNLKRGGDYMERAVGRGGSGGRTHAALLYSLGLWFENPGETRNSRTVQLTLAGEALLSGESPLEILTKQVFGFQYPSAYHNDLAPRFRLRPFILLLRLLRCPELSGQLHYDEVATCVLPYGEQDSAPAADLIARRILAFRRDGIESLESGFNDKYSTPRANPDNLLKALHDVAHTMLTWLHYTGIVEKFDRAEGGGVYLPLENEQSADEVIGEWETKPLLSLTDTVAGRAVFQRQYGLPPGARKDTRNLSRAPQRSQTEMAFDLVTGAVFAMSREGIVREATESAIEEVIRRTGLGQTEVRDLLPRVLGSPQESVGKFLDRYREMAFQGQDEAIAFEKATATAFREIIGIDALHIGQGGRVPDVVVRNDSWTAIIDTKAYVEYDLVSDHQLRMQTSYIPAYSDEDLEVFGYIAGGFKRNFDVNLRKIVSETGLSGFGIGITPWVQLLQEWQHSGKTHNDLLDFLKQNRELTSADVSRFLGY